MCVCVHVCVCVSAYHSSVSRKRRSTVLVRLELIVGQAFEPHDVDTSVQKDCLMKISDTSFVPKMFLRHWAQIFDTSEAPFQLEL